MWQRTCEVIPDGVMTLSKMPSKHVAGIYPTYLDRGEGAYVYDCNGRKYIDYPCALGAILLGYKNKTVNQAIRSQLAKGTIFSLPHKLETELAEKIVELIPSAEMVRFLKTGSEATSAAVKIARAYTGRNVVFCCGYHGWHDWYNYTTSKNKGAIYQPVYQFDYNSFNDLDMSDEVAAVIIEPYILEQPKDNFLQRLRRLCDDNGTLLIFDEVVTGFRTRGYSAQAFFDVMPDLTCLGKPMANGMPISCVCGKREIMKELEGDCFVSSTFGGELLSIAAALATIEVLEKENVIDHIWKMGKKLKGNFNRLADRVYGMQGVECTGYPCRLLFKFPTNLHLGLFWQECVKQGILFGYATFINFAHKEKEIDYTIEAIEKALCIVKENWDKPEKALEGEAPQEAFRLIQSQSAR